MKPDECREGIPCQSMCETRCGTRRKWVGLTDEEIKNIASTPAAIVGSYVHTFARAIEAALKERNT